MKFKLCYKEYDCKASLGAMKRFKEATGKDMWGVCSKYMSTYIALTKEGITIQDLIHELSTVLDFVDSAVFFHSLCVDSGVSIDEIEDGMFHAGILPSERDHDMSEPYPIVLYILCTDIIKEHLDLVESKKKASS